MKHVAKWRHGLAAGTGLIQVYQPPINAGRHINGEHERGNRCTLCEKEISTANTTGRCKSCAIKLRWRKTNNAPINML